MKALTIRSHLPKLLFSLYFLTLSGLTPALDNDLASYVINADPNGSSLLEPANSDTDSDGDGVVDELDDFPSDARETVDTDLDGVGNNADPDDDNDGVPDAGSWEQLGQSINGENAEDLAGRVTLSADGSIIAIGAVGNDENGIDTGRVRVYAFDGQAWVQRGQSLFGQVELERIGFSPSLSSDGSVLAFGGACLDCEMPAGVIRVFAWDGEGWIQRGEDIAGEALGDGTGNGTKLSADGSILAISAPFYNGDDGNSEDVGQVRVYRWDGESWVQRGQYIDGEAAGDRLGRYEFDLTADGSFLAIGAQGSDVGGFDAGHLRVYAWSEINQLWVQRGEGIEGEADGDGSGSSVSISDDGLIVAVGAFLNNGSDFGAGHVRIYSYDASVGWVQRGDDIDGAGAGDSFGWSTSLSADGSRVAIGAIQGDTVLSVGYVHIYSWDSAAQRWIQQGQSIFGNAENNLNGWSLSLSDDGEIIAAGAAGFADGVEYAGRVVIYAHTGAPDALPLDATETLDTDSDGIGNNADPDNDGDGVVDELDEFPLDASESVDTDLDGVGNNADPDDDNDGVADTGSWEQLGGDISGENVGDLAGRVTVSAEGSVIAVGAIGNDENGAESGRVRVYAFDGQAWVQRGQSFYGQAEIQRLGFSLSLSSDGSVLAFGGACLDCEVPAGVVRAFAWDGESWIQRGDDIAGETLGDGVGNGVKLSADGSTLAISAPFYDTNGGTAVDAGQVRVYRWNGESWLQRGQYIEGEAAGDRIGRYDFDLAADGSFLAIGGQGNDASGPDAGHLRVYGWSENDQLWIQRGQDIDGEAAGDESGSSVSISDDGSIVAVGAFLNDGNGLDAGHVRIYSYDTSAGWVQRGDDIDGAGAGDSFGWSTSLSADGSRISIGATQGGTELILGYVAIYSWDGAAQRWVQQGQSIFGSSEIDFNGWSQSLSDNGVIVATGATGGAELAGRVAVYALGPADAFPLDATETLDTDLNGIGNNADPDNDGDGVVDELDEFPLDVNETVDTDLDGVGNNADLDDDNDGVPDISRWVQLGGDIGGENVEDLAGRVTLSADGSIIAIGAMGNDENGIDTGRVRVYAFDGQAWVQRGQSLFGQVELERIGFSPSLSSDGSVLAFGGACLDCEVPAGVIRVFAWDGESWIQRGDDIAGEALGDGTGNGTKLSADGSILAIAAPFYDGDEGNAEDAGQVRVYRWDGESWLQRGQFIDGEAAGDLIGRYDFDLTANGSFMAVGGQGNDASGLDAGHLRVYAWSEINQLWIQRGEDINGEAAGDRSGSSVSISDDGSIVAVGAFLNNSYATGFGAGHVRIYSYDNSAGWVQRGEDIDGVAEGDFFGWSTSLSADGSRISIGAFQGALGPGMGYVEIYDWDGAAQGWIQQGQSISGTMMADYNGWSQSLSDDGEIVATGAIGGFEQAGRIAIYRLTEVADAFPLDGTETLDTDSDGIGNNADPDDDNDGAGDFSEIIVLREGDLSSRWDFGLLGLENDSSGNTQPCGYVVGEAVGLDCTKLDWNFVADGDRSSVLEVRHQPYETGEGSMLLIAATASQNLSSITNGFIRFDIKVIEAPTDNLFSLNLLQDFGFQPKPFTVEEVGVWSTITIPLYEFEPQFGFFFVQSPFSISHLLEGQDTEIVYRLDNVAWVTHYEGLDASSLPMDAFPLDASETLDTDLDGIGNNADAFPENALYTKDSDADGMPDIWEINYGLDPNDSEDAAADQDGDGVSSLDEFFADTIPAGSLDIDGNGNYDALTDGLLLLRAMFELSDSALISNAIGAGAVHSTSEAVIARIDMLGELIDIDGDGNADALTDGLVVLRYLFGLRGETLIDGVVADNASRSSAADIEAKIESLKPAL